MKLLFYPPTKEGIMSNDLQNHHQKDTASEEPIGTWLITNVFLLVIAGATWTVASFAYAYGCALLINKADFMNLYTDPTFWHPRVTLGIWICSVVVTGAVLLVPAKAIISSVNDYLLGDW